MRNQFFIFLFFLSGLCLAQDSLAVKVVDSLYREDQFYFGVTYNTLQKRPTDISQRSFSTGFNVGFLRDMPINKKRTFAVAAGLGLSYNSFNQNLLITKVDDEIIYQHIPQDVSVKRNKFSMFRFDIPIEFRWRNSTPYSHKFFRFYTGVKFGYLLTSNSRLITSIGNSIINNNPDFNKFHYGIYIATGYNTWNFYAYYGLNSIFNSNAFINGNQIEMNAVNFGLQFYIL